MWPHPASVSFLRRTTNFAAPAFSTHREDELADIQKEIAVLSQLRSPYVTRYIGDAVLLLWLLLPVCLSLSLSV